MAVSAATVAKITSAVASDKNARKVIGVIIGSVIGLLLIFLVEYIKPSKDMSIIKKLLNTLFIQPITAMISPITSLAKCIYMV